MQIIADKNNRRTWNISPIWVAQKTNFARCTREITSRIVTTKTALNRKKTPFTSKLNFNLRKTQ
jgi:hypothetical protein